MRFAFSSPRPRPPLAVFLATALAASSVVVAAAPTAAAQGDTSTQVSTPTLVSNVGMSDGRRTLGTGDSVSGSFVLAQGFTAGTSFAGYTLASIEARLMNGLGAGQRGKLRAELWSAASGGGPGSRLASLTVPESLSAGKVSFAAPENTALAANTTYYLVLYTTDFTTADFIATRSTDVNAGAAAGWSIEGSQYGKAGSDPQDPSSWTKHDPPIVEIAVTGTIVPTVALSSGAVRSVGESAGSVVVTATLNEAAGVDGVEVSLARAGTATETADYTLAATITIARDATTGTATLAAVGDDAVEAHETVVLTASAQGFTAGPALTVTITDDDTAAKPTGVAVTAADTALGLSWTAPDGVLSGYDVHYTSAPTTGNGAVTDTAAVRAGAAASGWVDASHTGAAASHSITGLDNGTEYRVRIRAQSAAGAGAWAFDTGTPLGQAGGVSFRSETETTVTVNGDAVVAAAYSVAEGDTVTVELGLAEALTEAVRFQLRPGYDSVADFYTDYSLGECPMLDPDDDSISDEERAEAANCRFGAGYVIAEIPAGETSFTYEIRIEDDDEAEGDESFTLDIFPMSWNTEVGAVPKAVVTIVDNDVAAEPGVVVALPDIVVDGVTQTADKVHTAEGSSGTYTIVLASQPESWVRIYPESAMPCRVRTHFPAGTQSRGFVEFTPRNWDVPQTVWARAELDYDAADEEVVITHRLEAPFSPGYQRVERDPVTNEPLAVHPDTKAPVGVDLVDIDPVTVAVADKHLAGVMVVTDLDPEVVTATDLELSEGATASNIVYPATDPAPVYGASPDDCYDYDNTHTVTVTASSSDPAVAVVSPASATFGPNADYSPKTFTITAEGAGTATITYAVSGSDPAYGSVSDYTFEVTVPAPPQVNQAPPSSPQQENPVGVVFRPDPKLPGPVTDVELSATADRLTVSWGAPDTGASPTGYVVHAKPTDGAKGKIKRPKAKKTEVTFKGLEPGKTYQISVRAKNSHGKGPRTYTTTITLPRT